MSPDEEGWVELPPPPDNPNAGFWYLGALQFVLVLALAVYMLVANAPAPGTLEGIILSAPEPAEADVVGSVDADIVGSIAEPPIPRMRDLDGAPAAGWVLKDRPKDVAPAPRSFVMHANRDMLGGDYDSFRNVSQAECADRCQADKRCRAYTFNRWENACFVKSSLSALKIEPRGITGVLASEKIGEDKRPAAIQRSRSRLFPGAPYRKIRSAAYEGCAKACLDEAACLGFNYDKADRSCALMAASLDKPIAGGSDLGIKVQGSASTPRRQPARASASVYRELPPEMALVEAMLSEFLGR